MSLVKGYHACERSFANSIRSGELEIRNWPPSTNVYDWLGSGIYFWEGSFRRAQQWADNIRGAATIIEADIQLGTCLDLTETEFLDLIRETYESLVELYQEEGWQLPINRELGATTGIRSRWLKWLDGMNRFFYRRLAGVAFSRERDCKLRDLDCLVINQFLSLMEGGRDEAIVYQTVRCPFEEGEPIFPGSMICHQTHIQISVRDNSCITPVTFHDV